MTDSTKKTEAGPGENARVENLGSGCYAYSADGCSNTGFVVGERGVLVIDGQATPVLAAKTLEKIREITDKPIKLVILTHYHADSSYGASAFEPGEIIASDLTHRMIETRGRDELRFARNRFPNIYSSVSSSEKLSLPSMTIASSMSVDLGNRLVRLMHLGRGHTMGDLLVWVPDGGVIYAGDMVQTKASPYCGDAHLADWPRALDRIAAFRPNALMPGRGASVLGGPAVATAIETTREFVTALRDSAAACVEGNLSLKDTYLAVRDSLAPQFGSLDDFESHLKFNVARAYDEALGLDQPQMWTYERCADLDDALNGIVPLNELVDGIAKAKTSEKETEVAAVAEIEPEILEVDAADENVADEASAEEDSDELVLDDSSETADLVSDGDFAASLLTSPEDGNPEAGTGVEADADAEEDDVLDLSEEGIIELDETASVDEGDGLEQVEKKVLEDAGA
ncbi:MAG: MBL fold metallo-hydrolase [Roseibium sp.]